MRRILLVGNPNVGKTTLFNALTKSSEHTGNFHGVTVEEKSKVITVDDEQIEIVDLPGLYSLSAYSFEEEVSKKQILKSNCEVLLIVDANTIKRNLYLSTELSELNIKHKVLINNYDSFKKSGNLIDEKELKKYFGVEFKIINAKKIKPTKELFTFNYFENKSTYLFNIIKEIKLKTNLDEEKIKLGLNGCFSEIEEYEQVFKSYYKNVIKQRYDFIFSILNKSEKINNDYIYGSNKIDKILLNPIISIFIFVGIFLINIYLIFFLIGPFLSAKLTTIITYLFQPLFNLLYATTDNIWLLEFFSSGVFSSVITVLCFLPQVCLLFIFLSILEDTGLISRFAFSFDWILTKFGLNGKAIYILLLGLGCNTMSCLACRNMSEKNLRIKTTIINPFISCMARLPVFVLIASAFYKQFTFLVVIALYLIGFVFALIICSVLNKTILPNKSDDLILEFANLRPVDLCHIFTVTKVNTIDFFKRVFTLILSVNIIVWILTHTAFNLRYTQEISESILYSFADKVSFIFAPIGLKNAGVICALIVGVLAKELIVSTISIANGTTLPQELTLSLLVATSAIHFNIASASSFLIFVLMYCPCVSNLAVITKEIGKTYMWLTIGLQFTVAYMSAFVVYQCLQNGFIYGISSLVVIILTVFAIFYLRKVLNKGSCKINCHKNK